MRTNAAMSRFKRSSKSLKVRKDKEKERTAPAPDDVDVNWCSAFDG